MSLGGGGTPTWPQHKAPFSEKYTLIAQQCEDGCLQSTTPSQARPQALYGRFHASRSPRCAASVSSHVLLCMTLYLCLSTLSSGQSGALGTLTSVRSVSIGGPRTLSSPKETACSAAVASSAQAVAASTLLCLHGPASCSHFMEWTRMCGLCPALFPEHHVFEVCPLCGVSQSFLPFEG